MIPSEIPTSFQPTNISFQIHIWCNKTTFFRMSVEEFRYLNLISVAKYNILT